MQSLTQISSKRIDITDGLLPSDTIYSGILSANTEQTVNVPSGADFVFFLSEDNIYVNYDTTAALPTGTISQAGGELNPVVRCVTEVSVLHLIAQSNTKVSLVFYAK